MVENYQYCRYDCYQVTLKVNISEEDGCLYSRYGQKLFDIKNTTGKTACSQCSSCKSCDERRHDHYDRHDDKRSHKVPSAVIIDVDVDRCDCTKAVFTLYVKLPCKPKYDFSCYIEQISCLLSKNEVLYDALIQLFNNIKTYTECPIDFELLLSVINIFASQITIYLTEGIDSTQLLPGSCDRNTLETIQSITNDLACVVTQASNEPTDPCLWTNFCFLPQKFKITSSASGHDREVITFLVNPLPYGTVSAGVFKDCYQYEVTRVACREAVDCSRSTTTTTSTTVAPTTSLITTTSSTTQAPVHQPIECCRLCFSAPPVLEPDTLRLIFPLTKEIRCLVPDFGLPGAVLNYALSELTTKVRIVPRSALADVAYPALLTFDMKNCTACLEFDKNLLCGHDAINDIGYEQEFGVFGCKSNSRCKKALSPCFEDLALARRIDVMGVHKCTEKVFFSFQICIVPYKGFCLDVCGHKIPTAIPEGVCTKNSFKIQSEHHEYSYTFVNKSAEEATTKTTTSTTSNGPCLTPPTTLPG
jgi:hypothetical protein